MTKLTHPAGWRREKEGKMKKQIDLSTVQDINEPNISECPYCGYSEYYVNYRYSGVGIYRYRFDGEEAENEDMYDCLRNTTIGKFAYCCNCHKKIFRIKD